MAIIWGAPQGNQRVGIDVVVNSGPVNTTTTSVNVTVNAYTQSVNFGYNDSQVMVLSGSWSGSYPFQMTSPSGASTTHLVASQTFNWPVTYGTGPTYYFTAQITGQYLGGTPFVTVSYTVPTRPASIPSVPNAPTISNIQQTQVTASWNTPAANGSTITSYQVQTAYTTAFTTGLATITSPTWGTSRTITGLLPGTNYYVRVRAGNDVGWGNYSVAQAFTTAPSGAQVKVSGAWRQAQVSVKVSGAWRPATVYKKVGGTWRT
jgi:hypothetical protein